MASLFRAANSCFKAYQSSLEKRPLVTKCVTGAVVFSIGDVISQKIEKKEYNVKRTLMMCSIGTFIIVPQVHLFTKFLDNTIKTSGWKGEAIKHILSQSTLGPYLFTISITCVQLVNSGLEFDFNQWKNKLNKNIVQVFEKSLLIWPAGNLVLLRLAIHLRVLISNLIGTGRNSLLSTVSNN